LSQLEKALGAECGHVSVQDKLSVTSALEVFLQENRAAARKPRDAASVLFR